MAADKELVPDAILNRGGVKVSKSPWGPRDEIGRLNWITRDTNRAILEHLDGRHVFDLNVEYFIGMPSWVAAGDPPYGIWMTHTPQGSVNDNLSGVGSAVHKKYSYCGDSIHLYTHCGTHIDTLNHLGFYGKFWNGWTADKELGSRVWTKGGPENYPPVIAHGVMLDVAGMKGVDCLPDSYAVSPRDLQSSARKQGVKLRRGDVVLVRTGRMTVWPDFHGYLDSTPGISLASAKWLCEEVGDPGAVTEYNVRFTAVVPVPNDGKGAEIVFSGRVKSVDPDSKTVTIALTATTDGKKIFGRAIASAKLA
jgi:kynurenine formamidase